jgi:hypothetical protein
MEYASAKAASEYYGCSRINLAKRARAGSLPTKIGQGDKQLYALSPEYLIRKTKQGQEVMLPTELPRGTISVTPEQEEEYNIPVNITIPYNPLCEYDFVVQQIKETTEITPMIEAKIQEYVSVYNNYWNLYHTTHAQPLTPFFKANPMFAVIKDEFTKIKSLEAQLGIGLKNARDLNLSKNDDINPFASFMDN